MIPNDLSGFSVEQLRGFLAAVRLQYDAVTGNVELDAESKTTQREQLLDDRDRLNAAIEVALAAEEAEEAVDAAAADAAAAGADDDKPADGDEDEPELDEDGNPIEKPAEKPADADDVVDEAVASAAMGGGRAPRVTSERGRDSDKVKTFLNNMTKGKPAGGETRHNFTVMHRETNHIVRAGSDATDAFKAAAIDRLAGSDKTAAGCFCGPDDVINGIRECCDSVRPFSDTLPTVTASGDVRFVRGLSVNDVLSGVTQWTCTDQAAVDPTDPSTWKPCFELECPEEETSCLYAVSACATFDTQQFIGNPLLIDNLQSVMECAFSKVAELLAYQQVRNLSSRYSFGYDLTGYGAGAQLLAAVGWAIEAARANTRISDLTYSLAIPAGLKTRILTDGFLTGARAPDETWSTILNRLRELGVNNVVELVDEIVCLPEGPLAHGARGPSALAGTLVREGPRCA